MVPKEALSTVSLRIVEVGMVESVVSLRSELYAYAFGNPEDSNHCCIQIHDVRVR